MAASAISWILDDTDQVVAAGNQSRDQVRTLLATIEKQVKASPSRCFEASTDGPVTLSVKGRTYHAGPDHIASPDGLHDHQQDARGGDMSRLVISLFEGPLDLVGDVHGEIDALHALLDALGYDRRGDHPDQRRLVFLGDLCDRGPDSPAVIEFVRNLVERGRAQCILGNHEMNLLRCDGKHGNRWYLDPDHHEHHGEFAHCKIGAPHLKPAWHEFFLSLPLALERADLRVAHAAWHEPSIDALRSDDRTSLEAFEHYDEQTRTHLRASGLEACADAEEAKFASALKTESTPTPLLPNLGKRDEILQMGNPVRVVTSGAERITTQPFWANGEWRMCDRLQWWNEYTGRTPVIVGHYWRIADDTSPDVSCGKPSLFHGTRFNEWLGRERNVFCTDFSVGGRYRERAKNVGSFATRLAAVRWPEKQLVFDDASTSPI